MFTNSVVVLNLSGGGAKIRGMQGIWFGIKEVNPKIKFDYITGVSSGSILSMGIALGKDKEVDDILSNLSIETFMSDPPVNTKGKPTISNYYRLITKGYLGKQASQLKCVLSSVITENDFKYYKNNIGDLPKIIIGGTNIHTMEGILWDISHKDVTYEDYLNYVLASSAIPLTTEGIVIKDMMYYDGGVVNHIIGHLLIDELIKKKVKVKECINIFSRPHRDNYKLNFKGHPKNAIDLWLRITEGRSREISLNDESQLENLQTKHNFKNTSFYLPLILKSPYDTNPSRLDELFHAGLNAGRTYK